MTGGAHERLPTNPGNSPRYAAHKRSPQLALPITHSRQGGLPLITSDAAELAIIATASDAAVPAPVRPAPDMSVLPVCGCPPDGAPHLVSRFGVSVCSFGRSQAAPTRRSTRATTTGTSGSRPACAKEARHAPTIRLACPPGTQGLIDSSPSGCWPMNPSQLYVLVDMQSHETRGQVQPLERKADVTLGDRSNGWTERQARGRGVGWRWQ